MVLTPDGRVSKYFYGLEYSPRDLRLGLVEASDRKIGTPVDTLLLYCYHYDPTTGKYGLIAMRTVQAGGIVLMAAMVTFWIVMWRRSKRRPRRSRARRSGREASKADRRLWGTFRSFRSRRRTSPATSTGSTSSSSA